MQRRTFFRQTSTASLGAAVLGLGAITSATAAPTSAQGGSLTLPVAGTLPTGAFSGTFDLQEFDVQDGQLVAIGTLSGTLTNLLGGVIGTVTDLAVTLPVSNLSATCDILHLELGPLDLDLLGLVVHLDKVVLDIDAESGSGNLLGNQLCAVARLLDGSASLSAVSSLLNAILGALG